MHLIGGRAFLYRFPYYSYVLIMLDLVLSHTLSRPEEDGLPGMNMFPPKNVSLAFFVVI